MAARVQGYVAGQAQTDGAGKGSIAGLAPGTYWVLVVAADYGPKTFVKVRLDAGKNTVMLTPKDAIP